MRHTVHAAFIIGLLLGLCFCCACTSQSPSQQQAGTLPPVSTTPTPVPGLSTVSPGSGGPTTGFDTVKTGLDSYTPESYAGSSFKKTVYRMQGKNLDDSGAAAVWVFTITLDNTSQLQTYDGNSWRDTVISPTDLPAAIDFDQIISPADLFSRNQQTLLPADRTGVTRDLDLLNSVYIVTITSGNDRNVYRFNATTGVLIS